LLDDKELIVYEVVLINKDPKGLDRELVFRVESPFDYP
jgi:hypothetical protein